MTIARSTSAAFALLIASLASGAPQTVSPASPAPAAPAVLSPAAARVQADVAWLASPELKGRRAGTPEADRAADGIAERFRNLGLLPAGPKGSYLQPFDFIDGVDLGPKNSLETGDGESQKAWGVGTDFRPLAFSAAGERRRRGRLRRLRHRGEGPLLRRLRRARREGQGGPRPPLRARRRRREVALLPVRGPSVQGQRRPGQGGEGPPRRDRPADEGRPGRPRGAADRRRLRRRGDRRALRSGARWPRRSSRRPDRRSPTAQKTIDDAKKPASFAAARSRVAPRGRRHAPARDDPRTCSACSPAPTRRRTPRS